MSFYYFIATVRLEWRSRSDDPNATTEIETAASTLTAFHSKTKADEIAKGAVALASEEWVSSDCFAVLLAATRLICRLDIPKSGADLFLGPPLRERKGFRDLP